ncbi:MAG: type II secretion system minor pseudopilin GspI [Woeseiaceae bacterium]
MTRRQHGFTLVEVMVALSIVALSLLGIAASMNQMIDAANTMRERTYASWIAQNKIAELRLANAQAEVSTTSGEIDYANTTWAWNVDISETGIEDFFRIDVAVSLAGSEYTIRTVTGFIGEPVPVGVSNQLWNTASSSSGEER